jgi:hypothetical protein
MGPAAALTIDNSKKGKKGKFVREKSPLSRYFYKYIDLPSIPPLFC